MISVSFDTCAHCLASTQVATLAGVKVCDRCCYRAIVAVEASRRPAPVVSSSSSPRPTPTHTVVETCRRCKGWRSMGGDWTDPSSHTETRTVLRKTVEEARAYPACSCPMARRRK